MLKQSLWALAAALFFSMMAACVKLTNGELTTLEMVFYRSLFGVITIGLFVKRNHLSLKTPHLMGNITRSILGTLSISVWFFTLGQLPFGTNMTLVYTTPLFMSVNFIILALLRHQRAPWGLAAAIIAGFSGITIILQPSFSSDQLWPALLTLSVALLAFDRRNAAGFCALRDDGGANACRRDQEHAADRHQRRGLIKEEPADDRGKRNGRESKA